MNKVILILVDGMRPDALAASKNKFAAKLLSESAHTLNAHTVIPPVTLPCHMSLFHSVEPDRHGITTNFYMPQVRPINGLVGQLNAAGKKCAFFFNWEQLRDLSRPGELAFSFFDDLHHSNKADQSVTDAALSYIKDESPDFAFIYLGETDEVGHGHGWMGEEYLDCVNRAFDNIQRVVESFGDEYTIMLTADHGGHDRGHGVDIPEDMTIPFVVRAKNHPSRELENVSIMDIAPTIASLLGASAAPEWEGKIIDF